MRNKLASLITQAAMGNPKLVVLSGDHGYTLFDGIRKERPDQFINCGVMEQAMVGMAAGLAKTGFKVIVYGLCSFIPLRVLEQIKLDVCYSKLPITFLGDGAGLSYSALGSSHHCGEDLACLRPLPHLTIYTPCDANEMHWCFEESLKLNGPSYIRIGRGDLPIVSTGNPDGFTRIYQSTETRIKYNTTCVVAHGSMVPLVYPIAKAADMTCFSVHRIKPFPEELIIAMRRHEFVRVVEEHGAQGGLYSALCERPHRWLLPMTLKERFSDKCGSWNYALSEHELDPESLKKRIRTVL